MVHDIPSPAEALADMHRAAERSGRLYGYAAAAPYLFVTGLAWLAADLLFQFTEFGKTWAWPAATAVATPALIVVAMLQSRRRVQAGAGPRLDGYFWKGMALWLIVMSFTVGTFAIFSPFSGVEVHSFIGLTSGAIYAAMGLFLGWRVLLTGLGVAALSLVGHFFVRDYYAAYMGLVCGGGMMLSALWLRKV